LRKQAKLCVIGGGGVRTPFVAKTIATSAHEAGIAELVLLDNDSSKLAKYGQLAKEIAFRINPELSVSMTQDPESALSDCDYIITTVRVGGDASRLLDEQIVEEYDLLTQETTGACGFAMAMRSIPVLIEYCEVAKRVAKPDHLIFNFTNPAGLVTQALNSLGYPVFGICDSPTEMIKQIAAMLNVKESNFSCNSFGLNHLTWFDEFQVEGKDVTQEVINHQELFSKTEMRIFDRDILTFSENYLLNEYLYFYYYNKKAIRLGGKSEFSRAELIKDVNIKMNNELEQVDIKNDFDKAIQIFFDNYNVRENNYLKTESGVDRVKKYETPTAAEFISRADEGGYAGVALNLISAINGAQKVEMVLSVPNNGAIQELNSDDVVEIMCSIDEGIITPRKQKSIPTAILNLILTVKEYERLAVKAILNRDLDTAVKALTVNPLVANHDIAKELVSKFVAAYGDFGGTWK
jgi:6-phospho-beta-glucosidase